MDEVISRHAKDKFSRQSLVVALLVTLNVGLIIVDRILLGFYREPYTPLRGS